MMHRLVEKLDELVAPVRAIYDFSRSRTQQPATVLSLRRFSGFVYPFKFSQQTLKLPKLTSMILVQKSEDSTVLKQAFNVPATYSQVE
jgi:hypothetical protein